jgi:hypothetical protein
MKYRIEFFRLRFGGSVFSYDPKQKTFIVFDLWIDVVPAAQPDAPKNSIGFLVVQHGDAT